MNLRALLLIASLSISMQAAVAEAGQSSGAFSRSEKTKNSTSSSTNNQRASLPKWVRLDSDVRALPGWLDKTPVLNSNSPEIVYGDGILVSTFPPEGKKQPNAHLNKSFKGRFDIFAHHIAKPYHGDTRTLYLGILLYNPGSDPVSVSVKQGASFLTKSDAPYRKLPDYVDNPNGRYFAGPGDRLTDHILRGRTQKRFKKAITLKPGEYKMLFDLPITTNKWAKTNCRSTLVKADTTGSVYAACLAMRARKDASGKLRRPLLSEWKELLQSGSLATPRDKAPTEPKSTRKVIYGRVAGVSCGSTWQALIREGATGRFRLSIPESGKAYSYVFSTLENGAFGTMDYQSAPMVVRYPDTSYRAHGNYGIHYLLTLPLYNSSSENKRVSVTIQSPYKENRPGKELLFRKPPLKRIFYRGTIRVQYRDDNGVNRLRYVHIVLRQADAGKPLVTLTLKPRETKAVLVDFLYPPDSTPPQILTVQTLNE